MSIYFLSRIGVETEVSCTVGFCRGLALSMGFLEALSSSSLVSIDFCHVLVNAIHDSNPRGGIVLRQRWDLNFDAVPIIMIANFYVQDWTDYSCESILSHESSSHFEASCIFGISVASVVLLVYQECRSIVPFREASNPHKNIVWIISCLLKNVRIFARILAPGFTRCCALV